ncbi:MAG: hypothetical protein IPP45_15510 [Sphingomonadales bacterium]|nr:hypothetical protein [Sphingomonadales bacterium]
MDLSNEAIVHVHRLYEVSETGKRLYHCQKPVFDNAYPLLSRVAKLSVCPRHVDLVTEPPMSKFETLPPMLEQEFAVTSTTISTCESKYCPAFNRWIASLKLAGGTYSWGGFFLRGFQINNAHFDNRFGR